MSQTNTQEKADFLAKIRNPEMRRLVAQASEEPVSVIIELEIPHPVLEARRTVRTGIVSDRPSRIVGVNTAQQHELENRINEAQLLLEDRLGPPLNLLRSSGSFIARTTPRKLRDILQSSLIRAVWPNRMHSALR